VPVDHQDLRRLMADGGDGPKPLDQLIDLLVYAPVGLLYEHEEVLPKLIRRGKSQVKLAKMMGQMAVNRGQNTMEGSVVDAVTLAASLLSRAVTELSGVVGLTQEPARRAPSTPPSGAPETGSDAGGEAPAAAGGEQHETGQDGSGGDDDAPSSEPLPIAGYDGLTARQIIPLLDNLSTAQRQRVRQHEQLNRRRKTVLAKLDRLDR
jgi:hypothetical protein